MKHFAANTLFDGQHWLRDQNFSVDGNGQLAFTATRHPDAVQLTCVIPGFVNCHSHSFQRAMAGIGERLSGLASTDSFWTWREQMYHLVQKLNPEQFQAIAEWLYIEMLEAGFTSVGEFHYLHHQANGETYANNIELSERIYRAAKHTGIRCTLLPVFYQKGGINKPLSRAQKPFETANFNAYVDFYTSIAQKVPKGHNLGACLHSIRGVSLTDIEAFAQHYNTLQQPIHIHIAEQPAEVEASIAAYGKRPVELLYAHADVNHQWTLVHATHVTDAEVSLMAQSGAVVGICPATEANLGDGIFPMREYIKQSGQIAIGSDSHIRIDPFEELRLVEYSQRYKHLSRACVLAENSLSPGETLAKAAYVGGERSLQNNTGFLREGYFADFIELDSRHPSMIRNALPTRWDELIFTAGKEVIKDVYTSGVRVVKNRHHAQREQALDALTEIYQQTTT